jgi:hypothetical protein
MKVNDGLMEEYILYWDRLYRLAIELCGEDLGIQLSTVYSTRVKMCGKLFGRMP